MSELNNKNYTEWIVPCDIAKYDCGRAFNDLIIVDWVQSKQLSNVNVNDIIYIYSSSPHKKITHQCIVNKVKVAELEIPDEEYCSKDFSHRTDGPFIELQCVREFDNIEGLTLTELRNHGLKGNIQSAMKVNELLSAHLLEMVKTQNTIDRFSNSDMRFVTAMQLRNNLSSDNLSVAPILSDSILYKLAKNKETKLVKTKLVTIEQKQRNPYVAEYAKRRANGICQLCGKPAPFKDAMGKPYLESHHIIWLSQGGPDTINNTVALCPNCHKKMHIVNDSHDIEKLKKCSN